MAEFPFTARATLKYKSPPGSGSTLAFAKGDTLTVLSSDDDGDWFTGKLSDGAEGVFPSAFVERVEEQEEQPSAPAAVVEEPAQPKEEVPASSPSTTVEEPASAEPEPEPAAPTPVPVAAPSPPAPTRHPSLPPAQDTTASSPHEAPKKPGSLRDRIAALNAQGAGAGGLGGPPPLPRAKPPAFKRAPIPTPAVASSSSPEQPSAPILSSSPPERVERGVVANPAFSAEDAKQSIGKGGSLKDRIAALQGMSLDTPGAPGRAPKPWKKKSVVVPEATAEPAIEGEGVSTSAETEEGAPKVAAGEEDAEGQVKDAPPAETETTAQSPGAEVPQFSPASPPSDSPAPEAHPFVAPPVKYDDEESPAITKSSTEELASTPVETAAEADSEPVDEEVEKRKAIAARMAGLGGQRVGMAMPALPKRAGPPRKQRAPAAASPSAEEAPSPIAVVAEESAKEVPSPAEASKEEAVIEPIRAQEAIVAPVQESETLDEATPINEPALVEEKETTPAQDEKDSVEREVAEPVTLGSSSLLASSKEQEEEEEDFDTPALPTRDSDDDFDTPALPEQSSPIVQPVELDNVEDAPLEQSQDEPQDEPEPTIAAPPLPPGRPAVPPPPPPAQPPLDDSDEEQVDDYDNEETAPKPDLSVETADLFEEPITDCSPPTSPATASRPAIPSIPASLAPPAAPPAAPPVKEAIVIPRSTEPESEEKDDTPVPTSPATASRPAIPGIPASFAAPSAPVRPAPIIPLRQPEEEGEEEVEEQFAATHTPQSEAVDSPMDPSLPPRSAPPAAPKSVSPPPRVIEDSEDSVAPREEAPAQVEGEEEEDEEEDPEVARRAALAARMAKLGGMNMRMGPMFPPVGGMRPATKKKSVAEPVEEPAPTEEAEEPAPPPRRLPGIPTGGLALPGIVAPVRAPEPEPEQEDEPVEEQEEHIAEPDTEESVEEELVEEPEAEVAPPPLPTGRPSSMLPPRRSIPTPQAANDDQDDVVTSPPLPSGRPLPPQPQVAEQFVAEPETHDDYAEEVEKQAPPPPPTRPQGGLPPVPTTISSPPLPLTASPPASPPSRRASLFKSSSKLSSTGELDRQPTRTSVDSTRGLGVAGAGYTGDDSSPQRANSTSGHPLPALPEGSGGILAQDVDLEQGSQWWKATPFGPPSSIRSRRDILYDMSESSATKRGKTRFDNEIEIIYADLSKTVITISFDAADGSEATTALSQAHHAPPSFSPAQLSQLSTTIGAQIFAAAHSKLSDKGAREQSGETLVNFCLGRATEPLGPRGCSYGAIVLDIENGGKGKASVLNEVDEPRAGDVIVFHDTKFKHNLSTTRVGTAERPFVAVVAAWDGKKRKVKTIEVGSSGAVEEGGHRTEDLKSGRISVWRVLPRDAV